MTDIRFSSSVRALAFSLAIAALLGSSGCAVGPAYVAPSAPVLKSYATSGDPTALPRADAVTQTLGAQIFGSQSHDTEWWRAFRSDELNQRVAETLAQNPDLKSAAFSLAAAREMYAAQKTSLLPQVGINYSLQRSKNSDTLANPLSGNEPPPTYTLHTGQVAVSYAVDLWGENHRSLEQGKALLASQTYQTTAAREILVGNMVAAELTVAGLQDQLADAAVASHASQETLRLMQTQATLGAVGQADLVVYQTTASQDAVQEEGVRHQLTVAQDVLKRLTGHEPAAPVAAPLGLRLFSLPDNLPYVAPADLVAQRPDILEAQANLRAAYAAAGMAQAARLPAISLDGSAGGAASQLSHLVDQGNDYWTMALGLTQPITNAVALKHQARAATQQLEAAKASYHSVVLQALSNVADCLDALYADATGLAHALDVQTVANRNLAFNQSQAAQGAGGQIQLLAAVRAKAQADSAVDAARLQRYLDTVAFYIAVGPPTADR
ncbi:efflux transporter outer membrane subunit [Asticcacaulis sp. 201]|uniref:efflux transporter outer membrane subunit n=1 Tax=Asticcacaulis sp. 201 TaxID=3028787 RepID=UPI0029169C9C|nr:efflux transporter outer membrane subunit [Asticcacaulis sp. 201]MDV6331007.1 efflux transporter outer membrane subunit [Asticcacaulis sp. 201]